MTRPAPILHHPALLVALLWCAGLGAAGQFTKIAVPFEQVADAYPGTGAALGLLLSLISLMGVVFGLVAGLALGRIGARRMLLGGLVLGGLISLSQAMLPGFGTMLASRLPEGLSHLAIVIAAPTLIAQTASPRWQGAALTLWSTFFGVAFALTSLIAPVLLGLGGLAALIATHGGLMLGIVGLLAIALPADQAQKASPPSPGLWQRHRAAYGSPRIAAPAAGWLFYTLTFVALLAVLPPLLPAETRSSTIAALPLLSIAVALGLAPFLLARIPAVGIIIAGFSLGLLAVALTPLGLPLGLMALGIFAGLGLVQGASFAATAELNPAPADIALANGAMAQTGNLGNLIGTPLMLALLAQGGTAALLALVAASYLAGIAIHLHLAHRRRTTR